MRISVIVPAFNEEKLIGKSLHSIQQAKGAFTDLGWGTELIVCDNNSSDGTADLAREQGAQVVFEPVNQIARARNTGAAAASGDWLLFIDGDSRPSRELFSDVAAHIGTDRCLGGGSTVRFDRPTPLVRLLVNGWNLLSRTLTLAAGSFIFCQAAAFKEIRGFSPDLFASEEIDFSRRLKRLARREGKRMVILHRHPLLTSARRVELYSLREHLSLAARFMVRPRKTLTSGSARLPWYDGRR